MRCVCGGACQALGWGAGGAGEMNMAQRHREGPKDRNWATGRHREARDPESTMRLMETRVSEAAAQRPSGDGETEKAKQRFLDGRETL